MATKTKRLRVLNEIYESLPTIACKGLCWRSCAVINVLPVEVLNLELATGKAQEIIHLSPTGNYEVVEHGMPTLKPTPDGACPHLVNKRCSVHEHRPFICRIFGVGEGLPCPHGCQPTEVMPYREVERTLARIRKI